MKFIVSTYHSRKCLGCYPLAHYCIPNCTKGYTCHQIELESSYRALQTGQRVSLSWSLMLQDHRLHVIVSTSSTPLAFLPRLLCLLPAIFLAFSSVFLAFSFSLLFLFFSLLFLSCLSFLFPVQLLLLLLYRLEGGGGGDMNLRGITFLYIIGKGRCSKQILWANVFW